MAATRPARGRNGASRRRQTRRGSPSTRGLYPSRGGVRFGRHQDAAQQQKTSSRKQRGEKQDGHGGGKSGLDFHEGWNASSMRFYSFIRFSMRLPDSCFEKICNCLSGGLVIFV